NLAWRWASTPIPSRASKRASRSWTCSQPSTCRRSSTICRGPASVISLNRARASATWRSRCDWCFSVRCDCPRLQLGEGFASDRQSRDQPKEKNGGKSGGLLPIIDETRRKRRDRQRLTGNLEARFEHRLTLQPANKFPSK